MLVTENPTLNFVKTYPIQFLSYFQSLQVKEQKKAPREANISRVPVKSSLLGIIKFSLIESMEF